jgi:hypothetical protein
MLIAFVKEWNLLSTQKVKGSKPFGKQKAALYEKQQYQWPLLRR